MNKLRKKNSPSWPLNCWNCSNEKTKLDKLKKKKWSRQICGWTDHIMLVESAKLLAELVDGLSFWREDDWLRSQAWGRDKSTVFTQNSASSEFIDNGKQKPSGIDVVGNTWRSWGNGKVKLSAREKHLKRVNWFFARACGLGNGELLGYKRCFREETRRYHHVCSKCPVA